MQRCDEVILVLSATQWSDSQNKMIVQEIFEFYIICLGHRMNSIVARLKKVGIIDWKVLSLQTCNAHVSHMFQLRYLDIYASNSFQRFPIPHVI